MGKVAVTFRIMPEDVEVDLEAVQSHVRSSLREKLKKLEVKPVAFGLKALEAIVVVDDASGEMEQVEAMWRERLTALKQVVESPPSAEAPPGESRRGPDVLIPSIRAFFVALAEQAPLVLVFEDLHWAQESLLDLLERVAVRSLLRAGTESPAAIAGFMALAAIPWSLKPLLALLSDFVPLKGSRRRSYLLRRGQSAPHSPPGQRLFS